MSKRKASELDIPMFHDGVVEVVGVQVEAVAFGQTVPDENEFNHVEAFVEKWDVETSLRLIKSLNVTLWACGKCGKVGTTNYASAEFAHVQKSGKDSKFVSLCVSCVTQCQHCNLWHERGSYRTCAAKKRADREAVEKAQSMRRMEKVKKAVWVKSSIKGHVG